MIQLAATTPSASAATAARVPSILMAGMAVFALPGEAESAGDGALTTDGRQEEGKDGNLLPAALPDGMAFDPWAALVALMPMPVTPTPTPVASPAAPDQVGAKVPMMAAAPSVVLPPVMAQLGQTGPDLPARVTPMPLVDQSLPIDPPSITRKAADVIAMVPPRSDAGVAQPLNMTVPPSIDAPSDRATPVRDPTITDAPIPIARAAALAGVEPASGYPRPSSMPVSIGTSSATALPRAVSIGGYQRLDGLPVAPGPVESPVAAMLSIPLPATWLLSPAIVAAQASSIPVTDAQAMPDATPLPSFDAPKPVVRPPDVTERANTPSLFQPPAPAPASIMFGAARMAAGLADQATDTALLITSDGPASPIAGIDRTPVSVMPVTMAADGPPLDLGDHRWPHAMLDRIEMLRDAANAVDTRIRVVPDALGAIEVGVRQEGDTLHVRFNADQPQTRALLQDAQPRLAEAAEQRGLRLGQTSVGGGADTGTAGQGQHRPPPAPLADPRRPAFIIATATDASADDDARIA